MHAESAHLKQHDSGTPSPLHKLFRHADSMLHLSLQVMAHDTPYEPYKFVAVTFRLLLEDLPNPHHISAIKCRGYYTFHHDLLQLLFKDGH